MNEVYEKKSYKIPAFVAVIGSIFGLLIGWIVNRSYQKNLEVLVESQENIIKIQDPTINLMEDKLDG